ncbi:MAG: 50S ribosomal protein L25/general stress protein Ctc [Flavobacteriales bacterium]|nr:50S ribosomal protein L25/general stress protein Ctc [Flavobacteriales bacterium]
MKKASLSGSPRENVGSKDAAALRKSGNIPAVLYGGSEQIHCSVGTVPVEKLIYNADVFQIDLEVGGKTYPCIIKEIQFHPVTDKIVHLDLLQLFDDKEVTVNIPVRPVGTAEGVRNGGRLATNYRRLPLRGLPNAIPEYVNVDITELNIGDVIRVREIPMDGFTILKSDSDVVVAVKRTRAAMSAASEEEEEGAEGEGEEAAAEGAE